MADTCDCFITRHMLALKSSPDKPTRYGMINEWPWQFNHARLKRLSRSGKMTLKKDPGDSCRSINGVRHRIRSLQTRRSLRRY